MPCRWWPLPICRGWECEDGEGKREPSQPLVMQPPKSNHAEGFWLWTQRKRGRLWKKSWNMWLPHWATWLWSVRNVKVTQESRAAHRRLDTARLHHGPLGLPHRGPQHFPLGKYLPVFAWATASNSTKTSPAPLRNWKAPLTQGFISCCHKREQVKASTSQLGAT